MSKQSDNIYVEARQILDAKVGPYVSVAKACELVPKEYRQVGQDVKIYTNTGIVEYWWQAGIEDSDLVIKSSGGTGDMTKAVYDTDNTGVVDKAEAIATIGRNSTGSTLYKGTIVYILGSTGNRPNFVKARANAESTSAGTFGAILDDIPNNSDGYAVTIGYIDTLDTRTTASHPFTSDTLADGDTIYLSPTTAGYITNVKPYAPNHLVYIGKVTRTSPTQGSIVYRIQNGYELAELHDVQAQSPSNRNTIIFDSADNQWKAGALTKSDIGLGSVPNTDATNPANITQSASYRFVTDTEKSTWNGKQTALTNPVTGTGTNNEIAAFNSTGSTITSLTTATYPSLTELSYVKGVTSAIQAQLNTKAAISDAPKVLYRLSSAVTIPANTVTTATIINIPRSSVSVGQLIEVKMIASTPSTVSSANRTLSARWNGSTLTQNLTVALTASGAQNAAFVSFARVTSTGVTYARTTVGSTNQGVASVADVGSNITLEYTVDPSNQTFTIEHITVTIF